MCTKYLRGVNIDVETVFSFSVIVAILLVADDV
jgi:hypothetical protein